MFYLLPVWSIVFLRIDHILSSQSVFVKFQYKPLYLDRYNSCYCYNICYSCYWVCGQVFFCLKRHKNETKGSKQSTFFSFVCQTADESHNSYFNYHFSECHFRFSSRLHVPVIHKEKKFQATFTPHRDLDPGLPLLYKPVEASHTKWGWTYRWHVPRGFITRLSSQYGSLKFSWDFLCNRNGDCFTAAQWSLLLAFKYYFKYLPHE